MTAPTVQQSIELSHLLFLSFLGKKLDKRRYALKGQVVAFLDAEDQAGYDSPRVWDSIQLRVLDRLPSARLRTTLFRRLNACLQDAERRQGPVNDGPDSS